MPLQPVEPLLGICRKCIGNGSVLPLEAAVDVVKIDKKRRSDFSG